MKWALSKVEDVALQEKGAIVSGPFGSNISSKFFVDEGVPVIRGNNLTFGQRRFIDDGFVYLTEAKAREFRNCEAVADDLVFTAAGTIGQVGIIPQDTRFNRYIISNKQLRVRCDRTKVNPLFLFLWFTTNEMRQHIINRNTGCSIPLINLGILRGLPVPVPPLEIQDRIASILSAYDDLIENNNRRIKLLETSARLLYREWFVQLRFPGYEHTRIVDGVPEGWERTYVPDIIDIDPKTTVSKDGEKWFVEMGCLSTGSMMILNPAMRDGLSGSKFKNGDTLLPRITPCLENGKTGYVNFLADDETAFGSTEFIVLRGKKVPSEFVYCMARAYAFRAKAIKSMIGSSGRQRVQKTCFDDFLAPLPPKFIVEQFTDSARPMFYQIKNLMGQNHKLKTVRDLLLPRLMDGRVEIVI
jgi:type I restriction enzyme S subunit